MRHRVFATAPSPRPSPPAVESEPQNALGEHGPLSRLRERAGGEGSRGASE